jgi:uncharacterized membrane protein
VSHEPFWGRVQRRKDTMPSLVTRFHLLIFAVTLSITAVAFFRISPDFQFPAHWHGSAADWVWPRDIALAVAPLVQMLLIAGFHLLGRSLTKNHFAKTQHIFDPALSLVLAVPAACQLALLFAGVGSDLDLFRATAYLLGGALLLLGVVMIHAERDSYAGLRMPWPIRSDRAWKLIHVFSGMASCLVGAGLVALGWLDPGTGILVLAFAASLVGLPVLAALLSVALRRL